MVSSILSRLGFGDYKFYIRKPEYTQEVSCLRDVGIYQAEIIFLGTKSQHISDSAASILTILF